MWGWFFFLIKFVRVSSKEGTHSFISIVQACWSRTIGNKKECVQQINGYIEQGEYYNTARGYMSYRWRDVLSDCIKWTLQLTQKWRFVFYLDCFWDKHIDFLLQIVFYSSTRTWLITFSVDEYHRIFKKIIFVIFDKFEGRGRNSLTVSSGEIRPPLIW